MISTPRRRACSISPRIQPVSSSFDQDGDLDGTGLWIDFVGVEVVLMIVGEVEDGDAHDAVEVVIDVCDGGFEFLPEELLFVRRGLGEGRGCEEQDGCDEFQLGLRGRHYRAGLCHRGFFKSEKAFNRKVRWGARRTRRSQKLQPRRARNFPE